MDKKTFKEICSRFRKEKRSAYVAFDVKESCASYREVSIKHAKECNEIGSYAAYHVVWNAPCKTKPISVVDGFRNYPDLKSFRIYNNLRSA